MKNPTLERNKQKKKLIIEGETQPNGPSHFGERWIQYEARAMSGGPAGEARLVQGPTLKPVCEAQA